MVGGTPRGGATAIGLGLGWGLDPVGIILMGFGYWLLAGFSGVEASRYSLEWA